MFIFIINEEIFFMDQKQKILLEYAKCFADPIYTIESYLDTFDKTQNGFVPFSLFDGQKEFVRNLNNPILRFHLVRKYRQAGISTVSAGYSAVKMGFGDKTNPERILILANKQETSIEFLTKITTFLKQLPSWVGVEFVKESSKHIKLSNGSEAKAVATSLDALRGYTPTLLILDEAAFIEGGQELWAACLASIGCLDIHTLILTNNGLVELGDIIEDTKNLGFHNLTQNIAVVNKNNELEVPTLGYKSDRTQIYTIKTRNGHTLTGSWKHPLIVDGNWKMLCDMEVGDKVKFGYNQNIFGTYDVFNINSEEINLADNLYLPYLLGLCLTCGEQSNDGIIITHEQEQLQLQLLSGLYGFIASRVNGSKNRLLLKSNQLDGILSAVGMDLTIDKKERQLPRQLLKSSRNVLISLMRGLFDGIGYSNSLGCVVCQSDSEKIISETQTILLNFGIRSATQNGKNNYTISILQEYTYKFYREIGFWLDIWQANKIFAPISNQKQQNQFFEDVVVSIVKSTGWTYDLHLPLTNSFNTNGFISHNTGGRAILISTPNGLDEIYYAAYDGAINGKNSFVITDLKWWDDPRYNKELTCVKTDDLVDWLQLPPEEREKTIVLKVKPKDVPAYLENGFKPLSPWYAAMARDMHFNRRMVAQELEGAFNGSGDNVIDPKIIERQNKENVRDPVIKDISWDNNLWIWEMPKPGHRYILGCDVSRGDSEDYTSVVIVDYDAWEEVLEYLGRIPPDDVANLIYHYGKMYNALSTIDITGGMGVATAKKLEEMDYPKKLLHYDGLKDSELYGGPPPGAIPGINFAAKNNRGLIVNALEEAVRQGFKVRSERMTSEMLKFVFKNGRPDHMKGFHDDLLMGLGMCLHVANTSFKRIEASNEQVKAMLDSWRVNETPTNNVNEIVQPKQSIYNQNGLENRELINPRPNRIGQQQYLDYSWLFGKFKKE